MLPVPTEAVCNAVILVEAESIVGLQVVLLDPVQYPGAMKAFAREVCRNDLLNFGRLHFFFPDSRMSLDLNTDKTLKVTHPAIVPLRLCRHVTQLPSRQPHQCYWH